MRPAWAHSWRCKSSHELITTSEATRNCTRATERGKEAWNINSESMNKNRIEVAAKQGERARNCKASVIQARWRKSGGCAMKERVITWRRLASA